MAGERAQQATRAALPIMGLESVEQAEDVIGTFCVHRYDGSFRWTDWPRNLDPNNFKTAQVEMRKVARAVRAFLKENR